MARFSAGVSGQSTLKIQLTAPLDGTDEICYIHAASEVAIGTVSRPALIRPTAPGIGLSSQYIIQPFSGQGVPLNARDNSAGFGGSSGVPVSPASEKLSKSIVASAFKVEPGLPIAVNPTIQAPITMSIRMNPGKGIILPPSATIIFYAVSSQVEHTWNGVIEWEES